MEGESLINDGLALTAFGLAVEAMGHSFTVGHGLLRLMEVVLGGVAYGLVVAVVVGRSGVTSARAKVTEADLARLDELAEAGEVDEDTASVYRQLFEMRLDRARAILGDVNETELPDTRALRAELLRAQRDKLAELYEHKKISDEIRRTIAQSLDTQEPRSSS